MNRREFLKTSSSAALLAAAGCATSQGTSTDLTVIDCHTHFFDPTRPGGVPWPNADSPLYKPTYPKDYLAQSTPHPVASTVVVEASPLLKDNQWILDLAKKNTFIIGFCGNLDPSNGEFSVNLNNLVKDRTFSGIRLSGEMIAKNVDTADFIANLRLLDRENLQIDVNGPTNTLPAVAKLATHIPSLRIVIDHLANTAINGTTIDLVWRTNMEEVAKHENVFAKVSGLVEAAARAKKPASLKTDYYASHLDVMWKAFGEDRLVYGSNWPVCGLYAPLFDVQRIATEYFTRKGQTALEKVMGGNAMVAYALD
jgi:L-fuconolactonase